MNAQWGTFNKPDSLGHCHAIASAAMADEGLQVVNTDADGPQFLLGLGGGAVVSIFLDPTGPNSVRATVIAFSNDASAEGLRNRVRQRIIENMYFQPTKTPWAIILCKFNDNSIEPFPRTFYENLFTTSGAATHNMVNFFHDVSHRRIDASGTQVLGWYTLPHKRADYVGSGPNQAGRAQLLAWGQQAAQAAGVNLSLFFKVVVVMNVPTDLFGGGGGVVCDNNSMEPSVLGQEMGHGYGLDHSRIDGNSADYMDRWDTMSTWDSVYMSSDPHYTLVGPIMNAANMEGRGWLDEGRVWTAPPAASNLKVTLRPLSRYDLPGSLAARVGPYLVEFRVKESWDSAIPEAAVLVHRFEGNHSYIMPGVGGRPDLVKGAVFQFGNAAIPYLPFYEVEVTDIDPVGHTATILVNARPPLIFPHVVNGALTQSHTASQDQGVWIMHGGTAIQVPAQSEASKIVELIAALRAGNNVTDPAARDTANQDAPAEIGRLPQTDPRGETHFTSPAPRHLSTDGSDRTGTEGEATITATTRSATDENHASTDALAAVGTNGSASDERGMIP